MIISKYSSITTIEGEYMSLFNSRTNNTQRYPFNQNFDQDEFAAVAKYASEKFKRITISKVEELTIYATTQAVSGISSWEFEVNFCDNGQYTGKYSIHRGNYDSNIPEAYADNVVNHMKLMLTDKNTYFNDTSRNQEKAIINLREKERSEILAKEYSELESQKAKLENKNDVLKEKTSDLKLKNEELTEEAKRLYEANLEIEKEIINSHPPTEKEVLEKEKLRLKLEREKFEEEINDIKLKRWRKIGIFIFVALICILLIVLGIFGLKQQKDEKAREEAERLAKLRDVPCASIDLINEDYKDILNLFNQSGFSNILCEELADLDYNDLSNKNKVSSVLIGNNDAFNQYDQYSFDTTIIIFYHSAKNVNLPFSSDNIKGENYKALAKELSNAGFGNIEYNPEADLIKGWIKKDGSIEKITINGEDTFTTSKKYPIDSKIIITYHTLKKQ